MWTEKQVMKLINEKDALAAENERLQKENGIHKTFIEDLLGHATKSEILKINPHLKEYHDALKEVEHE